MSRHAQVEEVADDPDDFDISDYDPRNQQQLNSSILNPRDLPSPADSLPSPSPSSFHSETKYISQSQASQFKSFQCIYPIYFDINRTRQDGRRVSKEHAVENPLAREIVDACQLGGLQTVFEPTKCHPNDWANPGRVRVLLKEEGQGKHATIANKRHLFLIISKYLQSHPTKDVTPLRLRFPNLPHPDKPPPPPSVPRGWRVNMILPLHSPALTGGGVSDNILKDMMQEMGGGNPLAALAGSAGGESSAASKEKKKDKKDKKGKR